MLLITAQLVKCTLSKALNSLVSGLKSANKQKAAKKYKCHENPRCKCDFAEAHKKFTSTRQRICLRVFAQEAVNAESILTVLNQIALEFWTWHECFRVNKLVRRLNRRVNQQVSVATTGI